MIKYNLICNLDHEFEAWFSKISDFDGQVKRGLVSCPHCQSIDVQKAIMAPNVSTSRKQDASKAAVAKNLMNDMAVKMKAEIEKSCDFVGDKFADEARAIHYGDKPERGIYGEASPKEVNELVDEGIKVAPLPDQIVPNKAKKLN